MASRNPPEARHAVSFPEFGPALQRLREARGWNRKELAERAQVDASTITRLESGERGVSRELAKRLAITLELTNAEELDFLHKAGFLASEAASMLSEPDLARLAGLLGRPELKAEHRTLLLRHVRLALELARVLGYENDDERSSTPGLDLDSSDQSLGRVPR